MLPSLSSWFGFEPLSSKILTHCALVLEAALCNAVRPLSFKSCVEREKEPALPDDIEDSAWFTPRKSPLRQALQKARAASLILSYLFRRNIDPFGALPTPAALS